jgi:hypothetical protein
MIIKGLECFFSCYKYHKNKEIEEYDIFLKIKLTFQGLWKDSGLIFYHII